jgi:hypothetical protein
MTVEIQATGLRSAGGVSPQVPWATGTALTRNPRFKGQMDAQRHRGGDDGWRFHGLPRVQD